MIEPMPKLATRAEPPRQRWLAVFSLLRELPSIAVHAVYLAPATYGLLLIIVITTAIQLRLDPDAAQAIVRNRSVNLTNLATLQFRVLFASILWLQDEWLVPQLIMWAAFFVFVLARVEHWLGTWTWIAIFVAAHLATVLITVVRLYVLIHAFHTGYQYQSIVDVGVSYGALALGGMFAHRLPPKRRALFLGILVVAVGVAAFLGSAFSVGPHLTALALGLALVPAARRWGPPALRLRVGPPGLPSLA